MLDSELHAALEGEVKRDIDAEAGAPLLKEDAVYTTAR